MCGRYASFQKPSDLAELYGADPTQSQELEFRYNVAPTDAAYAVVERMGKDEGHRERQLRTVRWGMVPSWSSGPNPKNPMINARVETVAVKPSWRKPFRQRRCVIPADGYYEWMAEKDADGRSYKQPYWLHPAKGTVLSFAGLYDFWRDPSKADDNPDRWVVSAAIITCAATGPPGEVHDRTPVVLPDDRLDAWLDPALQDPDEVVALLANVQPPLLGVRAVATLVNSVKNDGPELIAPLKASADAELRLSVAA